LKHLKYLGTNILEENGFDVEHMEFQVFLLLGWLPGPMETGGPTIAYGE
jgi:hypothetical protein